jgi:hypothetical protein
MLRGLWTIGVKVANLERELAFHRRMGHPIVLDETFELGGRSYRIPLVRMGDKYLHLGEQMVYEHALGQPLPVGIAHVVYRSDDFDHDVRAALEAGAAQLAEVASVSAGFGSRRVAFLRAPGGWIFEIIEILTNLVPEV